MLTAKSQGTASPERMRRRPTVVRQVSFTLLLNLIVAIVILLSTRGTAGSDIWYNTRPIGRWCEATIRGTSVERL